MTQEEFKSAVKEAITEWMDAKFQQFGKWSMTALTAAIFTALIYFVLKSNGWSKH